jgi:Zn-dependent protease/CBS domain-containing protein
MGGKGISLGNWFGVRVGLDPSLLLIFLLVVSTLGIGVFPSWHPDWPRTLSWSVAIVATCLFFLSILLHELAHTLVARAAHIPVRSITLFLFGGVANIEREPTSPKTEALMAVVGPLTSILLGLLFGVIGTALMPSEVRSSTASADAVLAALSPIATLFVWLGPINVFIGLFNLIPALPLDGGRILRAILWAATGHFETATRWAARVGQVLGWVLIVVGIAMAFGIRVPIFGTGFISGLWLAFIGWFVNAAAIASYREVLLRDLLEDVPVRRLLRRGLGKPVDGSELVSTFVDDYVMPSDARIFPVLSDGKVEGVVSAGDVRKLDKSEWPTTPVRAIAVSTDQYPAIDADQDAFSALRMLSTSMVPELIVREGDQPAGVISREDILRWMELTGPRSGLQRRTLAPTHP